ncbi:MAG: CHRD domain-containing protein [Pirellulales bacterium]|nr:CHRD domain-containing protein [Pirellulales bacterium]
MRTVSVFFLASLLIVSARPATASVLTWDFVINESQVKNGPEADGSTNSPATGTGHFEYDTSSNIISYTVTWNSLFGDLTKLHVHGPATAAANNPQHLIEIFGPPAIPASVDLDSDTWTDSHLLSTLTQPGFDPLTPATIIGIMQNGESYVNVHTTTFGMGEIRGNLGLPTIVPEPGTLGLFVTGCVCLCFRRVHKGK